MANSFATTTRTLLSGNLLSWEAFEDHKSGLIWLDDARQRRLFAYLVSQDREKVARGDEGLFPGLIAAWVDDAVDPATELEASSSELAGDIWRLQRIEASGFGGLTLFGGPAFDLWVDAKNWCLSGQNGSGKTSLASAIIWALTGKRIREQDGLIEERGERSVVTNASGKKLGDWPSVASYPSDAADLARSVEVWVRLTFVSQDGKTAVAYRKLVCPVHGTPSVEISVDPRLLVAPELLETGLLMPARLSRLKTISALVPSERRSSADELTSRGTTAVLLTDVTKRQPHFAITETPSFVGRAVAALARDPDVARWNGQSLSSGQLAKVYGFTDLDGSRPDAWRYLVEVQDAGKPADVTGYR